MNEQPSAARPRKARHLNDKDPGGHPLLYYCKFIAVFLCDSLSKQTWWVSRWLRGQQAKETLQEGGKDYGEVSGENKMNTLLCSTIESALKKHSFRLPCEWSNSKPPFESLFTWNQSKSKLTDIFMTMKYKTPQMGVLDACMSFTYLSWIQPFTFGDFLYDFGDCNKIPTLN